MTKWSTCPESGAWELLLQDRLPAEDAGTLEQHLDGCALCSRFLELLQRDDGLIALFRHQRADLGGDEQCRLALLQERLRQRAKDLQGKSDPNSTPPTAPPTGEPESFGRYRVRGLLGRGGMGAVYAAEDPKLHRSVAIKVLHPDLNAPDMQERFLREARVLAALDHTSIVPVLDFGEEKRQLFLVMPLLEGRTLTEYLRQARRCTELEVVHIGLQIARGLQAAHAAGIVHRDLKPSNVWVEDRQGKLQVRILDFGLARTSNPEDVLTPNGAIMGTMGYAAPEALRGQVGDSRSDLFSFGVILYELAAGRRPFPVGDFMAYAGALLSPRYRTPSLANIDPPLSVSFCALVTRLLANSPKDRHSSCEEVIDILQQLQYPETLPPTEVFRSRRRRAFAWSSAALLGVCLATGAVGTAWRTGWFDPGPPRRATTEEPREEGMATTEEPREEGMARLQTFVIADLEGTPVPIRKRRCYLTLMHRPQGSSQSQAVRLGLKALGQHLAMPGNQPVFQPLKGEDAVLAFDLAKFGWEEKTWREILSINPYGMNLEEVSNGRLRVREKQIRELSGGRIPFVRADWFLFAMTRAPLGGPDGRVWANGGPLPEAIQLAVQDYPGEKLDLAAASRDLGLFDTEVFRKCLKNNTPLRDRHGLGRLLHDQTISRQEWEEAPFKFESRFQASIRELELGRAGKK